MLSADALLLPMPCGRNGETIISGKVFEYLAAGKPILVVGPESGECERIVRACNAGLSAPYETQAIVRCLRRLYDGWRSGRPILGCPRVLLDPFSRVELTRRLAQVFEGLVDTPKGHGGAADRGRVRMVNAE